MYRLIFFWKNHENAASLSDASVGVRKSKMYESNRFVNAVNCK